MHYWFSGWHMIWMMISWLVGVGLFLALIWLLVTSAGGPTKDSPEEILRRRYAAGEINAEEYERRREVLRKTRTAA
jgi:putative membrane protein